LSDPRGMACRPNGKGTGYGGVLNDFVPELFILPELLRQVDQTIIPAYSLVRPMLVELQ